VFEHEKLGMIVHVFAYRFLVFLFGELLLTFMIVNLDNVWKEKLYKFYKDKITFHASLHPDNRARPSLRQIELSSQWETGTRK
jgi:hypothetical protein